MITVSGGYFNPDDYEEVQCECEGRTLYLCREELSDYGTKEFYPMFAGDSPVTVECEQCYGRGKYDRRKR
jgi:hypothetical protein